jgi:hypothetical protein
MSYPFLPVNPCCTDVVLNDPCGCTSTLPNTGCGKSQCGTNVILSSNVLYNGPVLDCIIAEPCDTLNVILQKIDEIICNLLVQINTLNIQVANITTQIININNQIININNTLDECCGATTTTTTTAITSICFCIHSEGGGCAYSIELPILGNAPFQNGRPVYNITGDANGTVYYDGSQWIYDSVENSPLLQPLLNSSYYPIGTYSEWGGVDTTYFMNSSTSGPCPTTTTTSSSSTSTSTPTSTSTTTTTTTI